MNYFNSKTVPEWRWKNIKKNFIRRWADLTFDMRTLPKYSLGIAIMFIHASAAFIVSMFMFTAGNIFVFCWNKSIPMLEWLREKLFKIVYK